MSVCACVCVCVPVRLSVCLSVCLSVQQLNSYMRIMTQHAVDPELVKQIFRQLYYFMCAGALNNLLLRKDMCNWSKGMQIR